MRGPAGQLITAFRRCGIVLGEDEGVGRVSFWSPEHGYLLPGQAHLGVGGFRLKPRTSNQLFLPPSTGQSVPLTHPTHLQLVFMTAGWSPTPRPSIFSTGISRVNTSSLRLFMAPVSSPSLQFPPTRQLIPCRCGNARHAHPNRASPVIAGLEVVHADTFLCGLSQGGAAFGGRSIN